LHQHLGLQAGFTFLRRRKIEKGHLHIFIPLRVDDLGQGVDARIGHLHDGDRRLAFFVKSSDLGAEAGQSIENGSFARAGEAD